MRLGQINLYNFSVQDTGDNLTVGVVGGLPPDALLLNTGDGHYSLQLRPAAASNATLTFIATDSLGASSTFTPKVYVCACSNEGNCTLEGIASSDASTIIMNCECSQGMIHVIVTGINLNFGVNSLLSLVMYSLHWSIL